MSGNRTVHMGDGDYREISNRGTYVEGDYYNSFQAKQSLAKVATEIQQLLEQLSQTHPTITKSQQMIVAAKAIEQIEENPTLMQRILSALRAGGIAALEQALNHPAASFVISALKDWQQTQSDM